MAMMLIFVALILGLITFVPALDLIAVVSWFPQSLQYIGTLEPVLQGQNQALTSILAK